ncbi:MAG TPA: hypothetical protein VLM43_02305 [Desulfobacterales bacterium]|nr:hypothetical protein [Desulfobacterales bacterium]
MAYRENSGGYESMVWVNDRLGREFACYANDFKNSEHFEELPEEIREQCLDVNTLIGTERW